MKTQYPLILFIFTFLLVAIKVRAQTPTEQLQQQILQGQQNNPNGNSDNQLIPKSFNAFTMYAGYDVRSYIGLGLMFEHHIHKGYVGWYTEVQADYAYNSNANGVSAATDADSSSSYIVYTGGGIAIGGKDPHDFLSFHAGLDYEFMTSNLMYSSSGIFCLNNWAFGGFKMFGFVTKGGGPYFEIMLGYKII